LFLFSIQLFIDELGKIELKGKEETMVDRSKSSRGAIFEMLPAERKRYAEIVERSNFKNCLTARVGRKRSTNVYTTRRETASRVFS
jgi:hypothetical protein